MTPAVAVGMVDALVVIGLAVMTLGVLGVWRMPDAYSQLHAQSKAVALGAVCVLVAAVVRLGAPEGLLGVLVAGFLLLTAPISAHVIGRAAWRGGEPMRGKATVDESESHGRVDHR